MNTRATGLAGNLSHIILCLFVTAGCSANYAMPTHVLPISLGGSGISSSISKGEELIYVANPGLNWPYGEILIYKQRHPGAPPIGTITDGLNGVDQLIFDQAGTLYVANGHSPGGGVVEYPFGSSTPSVTLSVPYGWLPSTVSVDNEGNVYTAASALRHHGSYYYWYFNIFGFKSGATQPSLQIKRLKRPLGLANDRLGNLYVSWGDGVHTHVSKCRPMSSSCVDLNLRTRSFGTSNGGALQLDLKGNLDVGEQDHGEAGWIGIYQPGSVKPNRVIFSHRCFAWSFALDALNDKLYCGFLHDGVGLGYVAIFDYATGKFVRKFDNGFYNEYDNAVALYPAQKLGPPFK
jgi:hypothetical protein